MNTARKDQKFTNIFQYYRDLDENLEVIKETFVFPHTE